ncbi:MAG TPA: TIGR03086 family metal-binding protein [Acidimicrobiales bacterium]|nr:TIGR03086 family metal-binding protein [Acidimicrobiales bacterium]
MSFRAAKRVGHDWTVSYQPEEIEVMEVVRDHRQACDGFTTAVLSAAGRWDAPSPCTEWDARGVLEHVIGFHDVLLLGPLEAKPDRPKDDPEARWAVTVDALFSTLSRPGVVDPKRESLLGVLTTDVLVHTWDLARAVRTEVTLDPRLCQIGLERALGHREQFEESDMFGPSVPVQQDARVQDRLLGFMGRDPRWSAG